LWMWKGHVLGRLTSKPSVRSHTFNPAKIHESR
jgi:hypothetical protein